MVEITDIEDPESLQAWLEDTGQPREACVALAHRAAMRVMPIVVEHFSGSEPKSPLPVLRSLLVSGVAGSAQSAQIVGVGLVCAKTYEAASGTSSTYAEAAYSAAASAIYAANVYCDANYFDVTAKAADAAAGATILTAVVTWNGSDDKAAWAAIRSDCMILSESGDLSRQPFLLSLVRNEINNRWAKASRSLHQRNWQFWIDWYERALAGEPQALAPPPRNRHPGRCLLARLRRRGHGPH